MEPQPTLVGSVAYAFWFLGEVAFKWVPGTALTVVGEGVPPPPGPPAPMLPPVTAPVTYPDVVQFLQTASAPGVYETIFQRWSVFVGISLLLSLILAALVIYCCVRIFQLRQVERRRFLAMQRPVAAKDVPKTHLRWNRILEQARGDDPQGWRLAILEADIMLNELLDTLGYKGETIADKMRVVERGDFNTIDLAWEAHRVRNKIAHEGLAHPIDQREGRRVITMYERVFREFQFIE